MKLLQGVEDPDYGRVMARMRARFGPGPAPTHVCQHATCFVDAMSEETLVRKGFLNPPAIARNVFLIRCHSVHVCSESACTLYGADPTGTCPVSGIQYGTVLSSYDRNDSRTWYSRPFLEGGGKSATLPAPPPSTVPAASAPPVTKGVDNIPDAQKRDLVVNVIRLLLWSTKRETRNEIIRKQLTDESNAACDNLIKVCALQKQVPFWTDLFRIRGYMMSQQPMLQVLQHNETLQDYYATIILQVWDRVLRFRSEVMEKLSRVDLEAVAFGVLYGMGHYGYYKNGVCIWTKDEFLTQELPPIHELDTYFLVKRSLVTRGQKLLRRAFDYAFTNKVPHSEIELDMAAITRAAASTVDPEIAIVTRDTRNRKVKITNKGEVLFMPVSRKKLKVTQ